MAQCGYCGTTILFGGARDGAHRFCNNRCLQSAYCLNAAQNVAPGTLDRQVEEIFRGNCPACNGPGPVDVHKIHRVWSALLLTSWSSSQKVCCRSCATKSQVGGALFSAVFGWWGFPWGLILTPVQVTRNIAGMCGGPDLSKPSNDLRRLVQVKLGASLLQSASRAGASRTPPPLAR